MRCDVYIHILQCNIMYLQNPASHVICWLNPRISMKLESLESSQKKLVQPPVEWISALRYLPAVNFYMPYCLVINEKRRQPCF